MNQEKTKQEEIITIGHSPDSDDAFMFYALTEKKIDTSPFDFHYKTEDIETLNQKAVKQVYDLTALSVHAYSEVYENYALLSCGASIGENYGPLVLSHHSGSPKELKGKRIGIPGEKTTAYLALRLFEEDFIPVFLPFDEIMEQVQKKEIEYGLIIHEGQITYPEKHLYKILDLGKWWYEEEKLPLPLGVNVLLRSLGQEKILAIQSLLRKSVQYALDHNESALSYAKRYAGDLSTKQAHEFVHLYVNDYTLDLGERGLMGIQRLFERALESEILKNPIPIEIHS